MQNQVNKRAIILNSLLHFNEATTFAANILISFIKIFYTKRVVHKDKRQEFDLFKIHLHIYLKFLYSNIFMNETYN